MTISKTKFSSVLILSVLVVAVSCVTTSQVFFQSIASGNYSEVKRLIEEAAEEGHTEVVRFSCTFTGGIESS